MKKILLTIIFVFIICSMSEAAKYYVFIDKSSIADVGEEAGQNTKGDVIAILPFEDKYKPTKSERNGTQIIVVDLTDTERDQLLEEEVKIQGKDSDNKDIIVTITARKRKINFENLGLIKQEQVIDKNTLFQKVILKPTIRSVQ